MKPNDIVKHKKTGKRYMVHRVSFAGHFVAVYTGWKLPDEIFDKEDLELLIEGDTKDGSGLFG
jgi:hypothetical protein